MSLTGLVDEDGQPLMLGMTHRFRHTKATSLLNAGVPLHVVQRYIGHTSPEMTMHYAQTLDATAKAEFLRYKKITSSGITTALAGEDLYDLMALDTRTDRVLPNGWCTLPPARSCDKGNACLTCDLFVTDRRFRDVHQDELDSLNTLVDQRQQAHLDRTGQTMSETHVWLTLRRREQGALQTIIETLDKDTSAHGAGTTSRQEQDQRHPRGTLVSAAESVAKGNPDNLRRAAAAKSAAATARAEHALRQLVKDGAAITFEGVAAAAGVSKDFLYRSPTLRPRIEQLRSQKTTTTPPRNTGDSANDINSLARTLSLKLSQERAQHRREVTELKTALAAAHGEILTLKRRFAAS